MTMHEKQILHVARAIGIQNKIEGNCTFFRDNKATIFLKSDSKNIK